MNKKEFFVEENLKILLKNEVNKLVYKEWKVLNSNYPDVKRKFSHRTIILNIPKINKIKHLSNKKLLVDLF